MKFQRQSYLENNFVSGFFSWNNFKGCLYWILPLSVYFSCIYVITFSQESFGNLIFITIIMLHPAVSIPIAFFIRTIGKMFKSIFKYFGCDILEEDYQPQSAIFEWLKNIFNFTTILYLACTTATQHYLFSSWINEQKFMIAKGYALSIIPRNSFTNLIFSLCEKCESGDCPPQTEEKINMTNAMAYFTFQHKTGLLLSAIGFMVAYHLLESFLASKFYIMPSKPFLTFVIGKTEVDIEVNTNEEGSMTSQENENELDPLQEVNDDFSCKCVQSIICMIVFRCKDSSI